MKNHRTIQGDMWDGIAYKVYGTHGEMQMHVLLEANPNHRETVVFSGNVEILVPEIPKATVALSLPPWKRSGNT